MVDLETVHEARPLENCSPRSKRIVSSAMKIDSPGRFVDLGVHLRVRGDYGESAHDGILLLQLPRYFRIKTYITGLYPLYMYIRGTK